MYLLMLIYKFTENIPVKQIGMLSDKWEGGLVKRGNEKRTRIVDAN